MRARPARLLSLPLLVLVAAFAFGAVQAGAATPQVATGYESACALEYSGTVKCFGYNEYGQVVLPATSTDTAVTAVDLGGAKATQIAVGYVNSCAVIEGGGVKCWGDNSAGALGTGDTNQPSGPADVALGSSHAVSVGVGVDFSCVLIDDGSVRCWGDNGVGQLGVGSGTTSSATPVTPDFGGGKVAALFTGYEQSCALLTDQSLWCWGSNSNLQVSSTPGGVFTPTKYDFGGAHVVSASPGYDHTCVVLEGGAVKCWGANDNGELGDGTNTPQPAPQTVDLGGVQAVGTQVGWYFSCALLVNGTLKCWGSNIYGEIGLGSASSGSLTPVTFIPEYDLRAWSSHDGSTCVGSSNGAMKCTGYELGGGVGVSGKNSTLYDVTTIPGIDLSIGVLQGTIVKPNWKLKRGKTKVTASATLVLTAPGMDATRCSGNLQVSVPSTSGSGGGAGGISSAPSFALSYANGQCTANAKRTVPLRVAKKGVRLKVFLRDAKWVTAQPVTTKTKLPKK